MQENLKFRLSCSQHVVSWVNVIVLLENVRFPGNAIVFCANAMGLEGNAKFLGRTQ